MKVLITGYGRMGRLIEDTLVKAGDEIAGWIDIENVAELDSSEKIADIIMDFSNPSLTDTVVAYAARTGTPFLSGTTNMTPEQHESLAQLAQNIPVIWASNYSLGINLFMHILPQVKAALPDWDIEITETHHNKKVDAPSGTAKSLADAIDPSSKSPTRLTAVRFWWTAQSRQPESWSIKSRGCTPWKPSFSDKKHLRLSVYK